LIILWGLLIFSFHTYSETYIQSLQDVSTVDFQKIKSTKAIAILFKANCNSCLRQIRNLSCLANHTKVFLLGAFSSEKELRREYLKTGSKLPAYYADQILLKKLKIKSKATPQILFFNKPTPQKEMIFLGYHPCPNILKKLSSIY
jgi:hypothetical protein